MKNKRTNKFIWWQDNKIIGTILLMISCTMQVFAFLKIPFISSLHGYTIGMLVGFFNPFFYALLIHRSLVMIFSKRFKMPKWINLTYGKYLFLAIAIIFVASSTSFYQSKLGYTQIGYHYWQAFNYWFDDFTNALAWLPTNTNGGLIGAFLFSLSAMATTGIGALVISLICLIVALILPFSHNFASLKNRKPKSLKQERLSRKRTRKVPMMSYQSNQGVTNKILQMQNLNAQKNNLDPLSVTVKKPEILQSLKTEEEVKKVETKRVLKSKEINLTRSVDNLEKINEQTKENDLSFEDPFS